MITEYVIVLLFVFILFIVILPSIKFVGPQQKGIVTRRGKYRYTAEPNSMIFVVPFLDKMRRVDINEYDRYMKEFEEETI